MSNLHMLEQVSEIWLCGLVGPDNLSKLIDLLKLQNRETIPIVKQILVNKVKKSIKDKNNEAEEMEEE